MIKKIILALILSCILISCGKKGDPQYKSTKGKYENQNIFKNLA